jgi:phospholipid/cholesterol/gamma-HCH transport system substrate-binding protein
MKANRERTLVGLFVLIAGGLLFGALLAVSGGLGRNAVAHLAYFKFAGGIQPGAPVRFGGMTVGKVNRVRVDPGNSTRIEIRITVARDAPVKVDSVARISTLSALSDNYIEISTGTAPAALAPPDSALQSAEAFGLPQLADAAQAMLPDVQQAVRKLNQNLDDLQVTLARANDLLNDRNRASVGNSLNNLDHLVADARPRVTGSLDNLNGLLNDTRPKVSATLTNVQDLTVKLGPLLDDFKATNARANDTLAHLDTTLTENRADIRASVTELRDTLTKSTTLLGQLNRTLDQNSPNIDDLLENLRLTTENLRALTETLTRSPASLIRGIKLPDRKPGDIQ